MRAAYVAVVRSGRPDAIGVEMVMADQPALNAHALFDEIDRGARQFQPVEATGVALEDEASAVAQQHAGFVDFLSRQSVASIARAAWSGSSAWVIGRPMTRIEAPWSSAWRGVITRFWSPMPLAP